MVQFVTNLLNPIFGPMGVTRADLEMYVSTCQSYIWILLALIALVIIVIVLAKKLKKKSTKRIVRWSSVIALAAAIVLIVNLICWGPLYSNVSSMMNVRDISLSESTVARSREVVKQVGEEGFVLLKNENAALPLTGTKNLNVFGWASTNPIYGGTGSGSSDSSLNTGILQGLSEAGFTTNTDLTKLYTDYRADRSGAATGAASITSQSWDLPEPTVDYYTDAVMSSAKSFSDTAVIVLARSGGEGADLPLDMNKLIKGTYGEQERASSAAPDNYTYFNGTYTNNSATVDDFDPGEHYLELSHPEKDMIAKVCENFEKVIVVINANNTMELGWVDEYPQIGAVIWAPGPGVTGFTALGEILAGTVNPSGRTVDTFVKDLTKTPTWNNFGHFGYTNVEDLRAKIAAADNAYQGHIAFVNYVEGIYVGYKFYETAAVEGLINYDEYVQYPFGYGLSYTTFTQELTNFADAGDKVTFDVKVTNTGSVAGKDVVEVYFTPPYYNGGIEKAEVNLVQFGKTAILQPGASETISFSIAKEDFASYDSGIKVNGGGYILEAGEYTLSIRQNSHTEIASASFTLDADIIYDASNKRASDQVAATNQFEEYSKGDLKELSRTDGFANYDEVTAAPAGDAFLLSDAYRAQIEPGSSGTYDPTLYDNASDVMPTQGAAKTLTLFQLKDASYDDSRWETLLSQMTFEEMARLVNIGGWQTVAIDSVGKLATSDCDGPAGLNNFITGAYGTSYPGEIVMAQTWNKELVEEVGRAMTKEYDEAYNYGWYGPAMNTHRSAFAGRNFEYYSEDGVLAGYMAAAEINGAIENKVYPYIKHFALNDQETNRCTFLLTWASEQNIRENYLKPFEIAVKNYQGTSLAVMSSFNFIGTQPSTANPYLLNNVLRGEWGFVGMVETDYDGSYGYIITDKSIRNGNDLQLGFGFAATDQLTDQSATATLALRQASKNILYTIAKSGYYAVDSDPTTGMDNMTRTFLTADIIAGVVLLGLEALVLVLNLKKKKESKKA